jgi:hypothetical protein
VSLELLFFVAAAIVAGVAALFHPQPYESRSLRRYHGGGHRGRRATRPTRRAVRGLEGGVAE